MNAKAVIAEALRRYRYIARHHRYGGMAHDYELAKRALDEIDALVEIKQGEMFEEVNDHQD